MESGCKVFKLIEIGASGVGKTALVNRLINGVFDEDSQTTIGVEFKTYLIEVDGEKVKLQIWDTAGQERFRSVSRAYFRNAVGAIVVFDLTSRESFDAVESWLNDFHTLGHPNAVAYLVGNKADRENHRQIGMEEATDFATKHDMEYIETSAASGQNVKDLFLRFTYRIMADVKSEKLKLPSLGSNSGPETLEPVKQKKSCC